MLSNVQAPESLTISGEGKGGVAGFAKGGADVQLFVDGSETVLTYIAKAQVGGKLAQLGARLIDSTAKKLADEFFEKLATRAASEAADAGVTERAAATIVPVKQAKSAETARAASATVEAAAPATAQAVSTAKPPRRFPFVAFGLVAVTVVIIAALAV